MTTTYQLRLFKTFVEMYEDFESYSVHPDDRYGVRLGNQFTVVNKTTNIEVRWYCEEKHSYELFEDEICAIELSSLHIGFNVNREYAHWAFTRYRPKC